MDIYGDRADWQMKDHEAYNTPIEWPENVFGEELGGGSEATDAAASDPAEPADEELDVDDQDAPEPSAAEDAGAF